VIPVCRDLNQGAVNKAIDDRSMGSIRHRV
jgi:hypothetical protein